MIRPLSRCLLAAVCLLLVVAAPAWSASGAWDRAWGKDVVAGNDVTGFEICTVSALCQAGDFRPGEPIGGELLGPSDVAVGPSGDVYVAESGHSRIVEFDPSGAFVRAWHGVLSTPDSLAIDGAGNVYVTDTAARVVKFDSSGNFLRMWGKNVDGANPSTGAEICTVEAQCIFGEQGQRGGEFLNSVGGVAASPSGAVYVAEPGRARVQQFDSSGNFVRAWGKDVIEGNAETGLEKCTDAAQCKSGVDGTGAGELNGVRAAATDATGNVYVVESAGANDRVQKFSPTGTFVFALGKNVDGAAPGTGSEVCTNAPDCQAGTAATTAGAFDAPWHIAVDRDGNLYTAEGDNHRIQKFAPSGAFISTWGKGVAGGAGYERCTTVNGCQGGAIGEKGGEIAYDLFGIAANPVNGRTVYTAGGFMNGRVQAYGIRAPTLSATSPPSPANDNQPEVTGSAQDGATVKIYATSDCTGAIRASGSAADLASPGLTVTVGNDSTTTFHATATVDGETTECSATGLTYVEDSTPPPTPTISGTTPASPDSDENPEVRGNAEAGSTVRLYTNSGCSGTSVATGSAATFASPGLTVSVPHGTSATFFARATDAAGNASGCSAGVVYETSIETTITGGPDGYLQDLRFRFFLFTADPSAGATFECALDDASFAACTSPFDPGTPAEGRHTFTVRARSAAGTLDPSPATRTFFVDTVRPEASIALDGRRVGDAFAGTVALKVSASDADPSSGLRETRCAIDPPSVPQTASDMRDGCLLATATPGVHTVYAAAIDEAGNAGIPASARFEILSEPDTTITRGPEPESWNAAPDFGFTSTAPGSTFRCRIDDGAFADCASGVRSPKLESGAHTFAVYAVSPAGLADSTPAVRSFRVRQTETRQWDCDISPLISDRQRSDATTECDVSTANPASFAHEWSTCREQGGSAICKRSSPRCPVGARCTLKLEASFEHKDLNTPWRMGVQEIYQPFHGVKSTLCLTRYVHDSCMVRQSTSFLGENTDWGWHCFSQETKEGLGPNDKPDGFQRYGPDSARRLRCLGTFTIAPAEPLAVDPSGKVGDVYVPGPGVLRVAPGAGSSPRVSAAASRPAFKTITKKVAGASVVPLSFKLSSAANRTYKKKRKLALSAQVTFTPTEGEPIRKTQKIVLRPAPRARDENLVRYRECRKLKKQRKYRKLNCGRPPRR